MIKTSIKGICNLQIPFMFSNRFTVIKSTTLKHLEFLLITSEFFTLDYFPSSRIRNFEVISKKEYVISSAYVGTANGYNYKKIKVFHTILF